MQYTHTLKPANAALIQNCGHSRLRASLMGHTTSKRVPKPVCEDYGYDVVEVEDTYNADDARFYAWTIGASALVLAFYMMAQICCI